MDLEKLGWSGFFEGPFEIYRDAGFIPARITSRQANLYTALSEFGELKGKMTGRMRHECAQNLDYPTVGDWVAAKGNPDTGNMQIRAVMPRKSKLIRADYNKGGYLGDQIISANVDILFIVMGLDIELNRNKLLRYIAQAKASVPEVVVILNKIDICEELEQEETAAKEVSKEIPVLLTSCETGEGIDKIRNYLAVGKTGSLIGPSGVGKSTLINSLLEEDMLATGHVREGDSKGRHTTTWRELVLLPGQGMLIDNPGMRSFGITGDESIVANEFEDIEQLRMQCKFSDCQHITEPGCAINAAIDRGELTVERYNNYVRLQRELAIISVAKSQRSRIRQEFAAAKRRQKRFEEKGI